MKRPTVTVRVPATTSNLGPGFDTLGIALKFHNTVSLRETDETGVALVGASRAKGSPAATAFARQAAETYFQRARVKPHGLQVEITGEVPVARGLGSSVT
ncbi:homoserine kinase, partial [bacterium]|nr:homoserine kinase [bacterium]